MSFLSRHRSRGAQNIIHLDGNTGLATPPREHEERTNPNGGSLRKRLSSFTLLGTPKRQNASSSRQSSPRGGGVGFVKTNNGYPRDRSRSPSPDPSLEIRRPSGLGRRASIMLPETEEVVDISYRGRLPMSRQLSVSAPNLSLPLFRWDEVSSLAEGRGSSELGYLLSESSHILDSRPFDFARVPPELLKSLFAEATKGELASLSLVCRAFVWPARSALYEHLNLQDVKHPDRVEKCLSWLASRRDIASIVRSFTCPIAPETSSSSGFTPTASITFAIALTNMVHLQSLTLPRPNSSLLLHTTFQLKRFSLLCESMSMDECRDMCSWVASQPTLVSLSFPNLVMESPFPSHGPSVDSSPRKSIPVDARGRDTLALSIPSDVLPRLSHFHGPTFLASIIAPGRPIHSLSLTIHTTLYDGLRPSALMASLTRSQVPITSLSVIASGQKKVDARTLERVLMSVGAELGPTLQILEIEWILEDELLYKQILAVLPRFAALHTLRLHRRLPPPPPRSPPPSLSLPPVTLSTPPPSPSSFYANSKVFAWTPPSSPNSSARNRLSSTGSKRISLDVPLPRAHERTHLAAWSKHCRTLRNVTFLSGAEWRIGVSFGETLGASVFTYVGLFQTN